MNRETLSDRPGRISPRRATSLALLIAIALDSCGPSKEVGVPPSTGGKNAVTSTFRILSVNVRHTLKEKGDVRRLSKLIKSCGAEIVTVQEIERPGEGRAGFDAVHELAKQTDMYNFFGKARYLDGYDSGNALFSIYPVTQTTVRPLPVGKGKVRRSLAFGAVDVGLRMVGVASTELDDESQAERLRQAEEIFSVAASMPELPLIVCGDFGESAAGKAGSKMGERFVSANSLQGATSRLEQHVYTLKSEKVEPLSIEKLKFGPSVEGVLVTIQVAQ